MFRLFFTTLCLLLFFTAPACAADVILNEYSAVSSTNFLNGGTVSADLDGGQASDAYFSRISGNGGDWFELVVITDHIDMRNWKLDITSTSTTNLTLTLTNHALWSDLRSGTIITVSEILPADVSYDPENDDWWINVQANDSIWPTYITNSDFPVNSNNWQLRIRNTAGATVFGPAGEGISPASGVSSTEIFRLEADPNDLITADSPDYDDAKTKSTFGAPNRWADKAQDFRPLRGYKPPDIILNEYNAVSSGNFLNGGDAIADSDGGLASDSYFERIPGNGGDWFELVIVTDHLDIRGWNLDIYSDGIKEETLTLTNNIIWADLRSGTIITISEDVNDDVSFDPANGDWWINVQANTAGTGTYITASNFPVNNNDWQLVIKDPLDAVLYGPVGEGIAPGINVTNTNIFRLEADPNNSIPEDSNDYDNAKSLSTFGSPNKWGGNEQNLRTIRGYQLSDLNESGWIDFIDFAIMANAWQTIDTDPNWNPNCDIAQPKDDLIDESDLREITQTWLIQQVP